MGKYKSGKKTKSGRSNKLAQTDLEMERAAMADLEDMDDLEESVEATPSLAKGSGTSKSNLDAEVGGDIVAGSQLRGNNKKDAKLDAEVEVLADLKEVAEVTPALAKGVGTSKKSKLVVGVGGDAAVVQLPSKKKDAGLLAKSKACADHTSWADMVEEDDPGTEAKRRAKGKACADRTDMAGLVGEDEPIAISQVKGVAFSSGAPLAPVAIRSGAGGTRGIGVAISSLTPTSPVAIRSVGRETQVNGVAITEVKGVAIRPDAPVPVRSEGLGAPVAISPVAIGSGAKGDFDPDPRLVNAPLAKGDIPYPCKGGYKGATLSAAHLDIVSSNFSKAQNKNVEARTKAPAAKDIAESSKVATGRVPQHTTPWQQLGKKKAFVDLFADNRNPSLGMKLAYSESDGEEVILEDDDVEDITKTWGYCLVGYFTQRHPGKEALLKLCNLWKVPYSIVPDVNGWIVFKFQSETDRDSVLRGGPYNIYGRSLLLKAMPTMFRFGDEDIKQVPVWVTLPQLPIECFTEKALGKIASRVGKPITTDKMTQTKERCAYARVLIEVDASKELVRSVKVATRSGASFEQVIEYEHDPTYCSACNRIGHTLETCKRDKPKIGKVGDATPKGQSVAPTTGANPKGQPLEPETVKEGTGDIDNLISEAQSSDSIPSTEMVPVEGHLMSMLKRPKEDSLLSEIGPRNSEVDEDGFIAVKKRNRGLKKGKNSSTSSQGTDIRLRTKLFPIRGVRMKKKDAKGYGSKILDRYNHVAKVLDNDDLVD